MKTIEEILKIIEESGFDADYDFFGLRADRAGVVEIGGTFEPSHQWYQDYIWDDSEVEDIYDDPDHPYSADKGCWDAGELDGTCSVGISEIDADHIAKALEAVEAYRFDEYTTIYLIAGTYAQGGNDSGESIITDAQCLAVID